MKRFDKRIVVSRGKYQVIEVNIIHRESDEILDTCYEVREQEVFVTEFDTEQEALAQLEFMLDLEQDKPL